MAASWQIHGSAIVGFVACASASSYLVQWRHILTSYIARGIHTFYVYIGFPPCAAGSPCGPVDPYGRSCVKSEWRSSLNRQATQVSMKRKTPYHVLHRATSSTSLFIKCRLFNAVCRIREILDGTLQLCEFKKASIGSVKGSQYTDTAQ